MLVKRNPVFPNIFDDLLNDLAINGSGNHKTINPAVNIIENKNNYLLFMAAPGLEKKDFNIDIHENVLTISVKKESNKEEKNENQSLLKEYNYSTFERSFNLPKDTVDTENISASYKNGELLVEIPKVELIEPKPKLIEVK